MKKPKSTQYTLRKVPPDVDRTLRERAHQFGLSLNEAALNALQAGSGLAPDALRFHDLDALAGTWVSDPAFDKAIQSVETLDPDLLK